MMTISLKDFCISGQFGDVKPGMHISEVKRLLGTPDHEQDFDTGSSGIMYAWYEFFYFTDTKILYAIQNDHLAPFPNFKGAEKINAHKAEIEFENEQFRIDTWFLKPGVNITYREIIDLLQKEGISFAEIEDSSQGYIIEFESGVRLDFDNEENTGTSKADWILNGMRLFRVE